MGERPRTRRATALGAVAVGTAAAGAALGPLWARLAPPIHGVVVLTRSGERVQAYLGDEAEHFFVAPVLLIGLLTMLAVLAAALAWQWIAHRGPAMVAALAVGMVTAAGLATLTGGRLVQRRYGVIDVDAAPVSPEHRVHYVADAPPVFFGHTPLQIAATLLLPASVAALSYGLCATWAARDDLGGHPPVDPPGRRTVGPVPGGANRAAPASAPAAPVVTSEGGPPPRR